MRLTYISPGVFDMGGISRYSRYQASALRELLGEGSVKVFSLLGPNGHGFTDPFPVDFVAGGNGAIHKGLLVARGFGSVRPRGVYWGAHLHLAPLARAYAFASGGQAVVNIYGWEIWSTPRERDLTALRRAWVVSDCHATLDYAVNNGVVDPARATVIWDPVPLETFFPAPPREDVLQKYGLASHVRFRVLFLGRLSPEAAHKGPDRLIRAFGMADLPPNSELVIAGSGASRSNLEQLAHEIGCADHIRFIGRVEDEDLPDVYRSASLFVLVSRRYHRGGEGIPLTPLEAAACGVPVVVGNEDGSREAVVDAKTGFLIRTRDPEELRVVLERAAREPASLRALGDAGSRRVRAEFSYQRFVRAHREFLDRIGVRQFGSPSR